MCLVLDGAAYMRLRALMVDLTLYKCRWEASCNPWKLGEGVVEHPSQTATHHADMEPIAVPQMEHAEVKVKRRQARSIEVGAADLAGMTICQFDGGAAQRLGFSGVLVWGPSGELWGARAC